jgi:hypothetical protein
MAEEVQSGKSYWWFLITDFDIDTAFACVLSSYL